MSSDHTELEEPFIIDAVGHAFNFAPSNYHHEQAEDFVNLAYDMTKVQPPEYHVTKDSFASDWSYEVLASIFFRESYTDLGVNHVLPVTAFKDGQAGYVERAQNLEENYPNRIWNYAGVNPLAKDHPIQKADSPVEEFERQTELIDAKGLKLYPSHWDREEYTGWAADDPEIAYPLYEKAIELGVDTIGVHKALPVGPNSVTDMEVGDVSNAAGDFPELNFEIVHGGLAFAEETSNMLATQPNVYVNLEWVTMLCITQPSRFVDQISKLLKFPGKAGLDRLVWGTGAGYGHPQLLLEAFWDIDFPEIEGYYETFTITDEDKKKILGENYARMHDVDMAELEAGIGDDEFSDRKPLEKPFSELDRIADAEAD